jgi:hypothetical protein
MCSLVASPRRLYSLFTAFLDTCVAAWPPVFVMAPPAEAEVVRFAAQHTLPGGANMCSSAATAVCVLMALLAPNREPPDAATLSTLMEGAARTHQRICRAGEQVLSVAEVVARSRFRQWLERRGIQVDNFEVGGLVAGTPLEMRSAHCMDLADMLGALADGACCALTCAGHTVSAGRRGTQWWLCDSLPGTFARFPRLPSLVAQVCAALPGHSQYSAVVFTAPPRAAT